MKHAAIVFLGLVLLSLGTGCNEDEAPLLRRSHDRIACSYQANTQQLLIQSNGRWQLAPQDDWITCSPAEGVGTGTEQTVAVSVLQNDGDPRTGTILLFDPARPDDPLYIEVVQEDGHFLLGEATMPAALDIGVELYNKRVEIAYEKAKPGYKANVRATLDGPGSEGIAVRSLSGYAMEPGSGSIPVQLTGTPTHKGSFTLTLDVEIIPATGAPVTRSLTVKSRIKLPGEVSVKVYKLLPRMVVLDWGVYEKGTAANFSNGDPRLFSFGLTREEEGPDLRSFTSTTANWLLNGIFFANNRFAIANLEPGGHYWFWIVAHKVGGGDADSDKTWLEFTLPEEEPLAENILLNKDFDDFCFGGCPTYQAFGASGEGVADAARDPDAQSTWDQTHATRNPDYFPWTYSAKATPILWKAYWEGERYGTNYADADYPGWQHNQVRHCTGGAVLFNNTSCLKTPLLTALGDGEAEITLSVETVPYYEPFKVAYGRTFYIRVEGPGKIVDKGPTGTVLSDDAKSLTATINPVAGADKGPLYDYSIPTQHLLRIAGATRATRIVFAAEQQCIVTQIRIVRE